MKELSKSIPRRLANSNFLRRYFVGNGVDIGGKPDPLSLYKEFFPGMNEVKVWDWEDGDAQSMQGIPDEHFDFVHSSHCLEHLVEPFEGLKTWFRVLKAGGYLIITVPDEDLYEQGIFPSNKNLDHKWTFTINKQHSWCDKSINIFEIIGSLGAQARTEKIELLNSTYRYNLPPYDQTYTPIGECAIEFVVRKSSLAEAEVGIMTLDAPQPPENERVYFNQYKDDYVSMKTNNFSLPPFTNVKKL